jgi:hypothetical protein
VVAHASTFEGMRCATLAGVNHRARRRWHLEIFSFMKQSAAWPSASHWAAGDAIAHTAAGRKAPAPEPDRIQQKRLSRKPFRKAAWK